MNDWAKVGIVLFLVLSWVGFLFFVHAKSHTYPIADYSCEELQEGKLLLAKESFIRATYYSNSTISQEITKRCLSFRPI